MKAGVPGSLTSWGGGAGYALNIPPDLRNPIQIAAGPYVFYALQSDGRAKLLSDVYYDELKPPPSATNLIQISVCDFNIVGLRADGTVIAWGVPGVVGHTLITNSPPDLKGVIAVAAGSRHSIALKSDGTVVSWGDPENNFNVLNQPPGLTNVKSIAAAEAVSAAVLADGSVIPWGNLSGVGAPVGFTSGIKQIAFGYGHSVLLWTNGTVVTLGNHFPVWRLQPAGLTNVASLRAGAGQIAAIKQDGSVVMWGWDNEGQATVPVGISNVVDVGCAYLMTLALTRAPALQPADANVYVLAGDTLHLEARPIYDDYTYQIVWSPYAPASLSLTKTNMQALNAGDYNITIRNAYGSAAQRVAQVTVLPSTPRLISMTPRDVLIAPGQGARFTAVVIGSESIRYQWRRLRSGVPSEILSTEPSLLLSNLYPEPGQDFLYYQLTATNQYAAESFDAVRVRFNTSGQFYFTRVDRNTYTFFSSLNVDIDRDYNLEFSSDLKTWSPVVTFRSATGYFIYADGWSPYLSQRFYRVKSSSP